MRLADLAPLRPIFLAIASTVAIAIAVAGAPRVLAPPSRVVERPPLEPCRPRADDPLAAPISDQRGGYYVTAEVTSVIHEPVNTTVQHLDLCVVDGARLGVGALTLLELQPSAWRLGDRVFAHVVPGRPGPCRVPRGTSLLYVECSPE